MVNQLPGITPSKTTPNTGPSIGGVNPAPPKVETIPSKEIPGDKGQTNMPEIFKGKMVTRCKMRCEHNEEIAGSTPRSHRLILRAVYQDGAKENQEFFAATPDGMTDLRIVSPAAAYGFIPGRFYYCDFTEAAE